MRWNRTDVTASYLTRRLCHSFSVLPAKQAIRIAPGGLFSSARRLSGRSLKSHPHLWCERENLGYILGLAQNARLKKQIEVEMAQAAAQYEQTKAPVRVLTEFLYATQDTWSRQRRVIAKAEDIAKGPNPRFIVTLLSQEQMAGQELYEKVYCARGECPENRIKERQLDLFADRTSTGKMWSSQAEHRLKAVACCNGLKLLSRLKPA